MRLFFISVLLFLFACSPQQRLARLLRKHPELIKHDTIFRKDTIITNYSSKDTIFSNTISKDTIIIKENNLTIKYFNSRDSIYIKGECDTIKIIREIPIAVNSVEYKEVKTKWYDWLFRILLLLTTGAVIFAFFLLRRK